MALINCIECGNEISDKAQICIKCGAPIVKETREFIIGNPHKIENIEIAEYDFRNDMNWFDAKVSCENLGDGWRLPTKDEFKKFLSYNRKQYSLNHLMYWSSTESDDKAWIYNSVMNHYTNKNDQKHIYVRAVRTI